MSVDAGSLYFILIWLARGTDEVEAALGEHVGGHTLPESLIHRKCRVTPALSACALTKETSDEQSRRHYAFYHYLPELWGTD